jgi:hypothetical protein
MWWRLTILGLATVAVLVLLNAPMATTVTVQVDLPPGAGATPQQVDTAVNAAVNAGTVAFNLAVVGVAAWLARHIIRKHRKPVA